jgi:hypothetical protein
MIQLIIRIIRGNSMEYDAGHHAGYQQHQGAREALRPSVGVVRRLGEYTDPEMAVTKVLTGLQEELVHSVIQHLILVNRWNFGLDRTVTFVDCQPIIKDTMPLLFCIDIVNDNFL